MNARRALILIDIQNDFLPGGALAVREGDAVIPVANRVQQHFDLVIASKDWHPRNHASFAANHPGKKVGDVIELAGLPQILWPVHCVQQTTGAEFGPGLRTNRISHVVFKGADPAIDSYSAFFDNAHRRSTHLSDYLRERGVSDIYILGLATDYVAKFTALDAINEGLNVHVIEDGCRGVNIKLGDSAAAIEQIRRAGARIVHSDALHAEV